MMVVGSYSPGQLITGLLVYLRQRFWSVTPPRIRQQAGSSPPDVVGQQRQVQREGEPLGRAEEHHAEEEMDEVLRENQLHGAQVKEAVTITKQRLPRGAGGLTSA